MNRLTWREASAEDAKLLWELFCLSRLATFAPLNLRAEQLATLLDTQYRARNRTYAEAYPDALNMILLKGDVVVGRHLVERHENTFRSIDLAVLPAHQNQGIGTLAIQQLQEKAALEDKTIHLSASKTNPALGLYQRLGFFPLYEDDVSVELEWLPPARMTKACL